jgi:hypothetical protein
MEKRYIPGTISEIMDYLGSMMLSSPTMTHPEFPFLNIDSTFYALNEGLARASKKLGEERYAKLLQLSNRMRAHFEADLDDTNGEARKGRRLINEMEDLLLGRDAKG